MPKSVHRERIGSGLAEMVGGRQFAPEFGQEIVSDGLGALGGFVFGEDAILAERKGADRRQNGERQQDQQGLSEKGRLLMEDRFGHGW